MSEIPSLKDELNRKTFETIERLVHDRNIGKSTDAQYDYGVEVLWSAVAGLVERDFMNIAAEMRLTTREDDSFRSKLCLRNPKGDSVVIENNHAGQVTMTVYRAGKSEPSNQQVFDMKAEERSFQCAMVKFNELALKLEANGFYRI